MVGERAVDWFAAYDQDDVYGLITESSAIQTALRHTNSWHRKRIDGLTTSLHIRHHAPRAEDVVHRFRALEALTIDVSGQVQSMVDALFCSQSCLEKLGRKLRKLTLREAAEGASVPSGISFLIGLRSLQLLGYRATGLDNFGVVGCLTNLHLLRVEVARGSVNDPRELNFSNVELPPSLQTLQLLSSWAIVAIPLSVARLSRLITLAFEGCTPAPEGMFDLRSLQSLHVDLDTDELPVSVLELTALHTLSISDSELAKLPEGISALAGLHALEVFSQSLRQLPWSISALTGLSMLFLGFCDNLELVPEGVSVLTGLQTLRVNYSERLTSLPEGLSALTGLQTLDLWNCSVLVELPEGISALTALQELDLSFCNSLTALPDGISALTGLKHLRLQLCECLPAEQFGKIWGLTTLQVLNLDHTALEQLPESISLMTALRSLDLSCCVLLEELPPAIGELPNLEELLLLEEFPDNPLELTLPTELRQLRDSAKVFVIPGSKVAAEVHMILDGSGVHISEPQEYDLQRIGYEE